jgi:lipopolysaccharide export system protein LptA
MIRTVFALLAIVALASGIAVAKPTPATSPRKNATATPAPATTVTAGAWTVHMSEVDYNSHSGDFSTSDHIAMTRNGGDINADRASGNSNSKLWTLYGHVIVHDVAGAFDSKNTPSTKNKGPATLTCDQLKVDDKAKVYVATGHVHYTQDKTVADADHGTMDDQAHTMDLSGNVKIVDGPESLSGDRVHYDTATGQMHAESDTPGAVLMEFPGGAGPSIATPRPIHIRNPLNKKAPQPTPSP